MGMSEVISIEPLVQHNNFLESSQDNNLDPNQCIMWVLRLTHSIQATEYSCLAPG